MRLIRFAACLTFASSSLTAVHAAEPDLRLVSAAQRQDTRAVRALLSERVDVNATQPDGATALHWAAQWNDVETIDLLLRAGARVNAVNELGVSPLLVAAANANATVLERLLQGGADANAASPAGVTGLMMAARTGNVGAIRALLTHGARVNAAEPARGQSALMWAVAKSHAEAVTVLLEAGADVNASSSGGFTPLLFAAEIGHVETARILVAAGGNLNHVASDESKKDPGLGFFTHGFARTVVNGASVLQVAIYSGHSELASFLLERGADPNVATAGYTALHAAVLIGDAGLVKALLARGADPNAQVTKGFGGRGQFTHDLVLGRYQIGATPFWLAAAFAEVEIMRALAAGGADPLRPARNNVTPLMAAAGLVWPDGRDRRGRDFFVDAETLARDTSSLEAVTLAVALGGDVNAVNNGGETALHGAASKGLDPVVKFLAERGADLNAVSKTGLTPLSVTKGRRYEEKFDPEFAGDQSVRTSTVNLLRTLGAKQ